MRLGTIRSTLLLITWCLTGSLRRLLRQVPHGPRAVGRELVRHGVLAVAVLRCLAVMVLRRKDAEQLIRLSRLFLTDPTWLFRNPDTACYAVRRLMHRQRYRQAVAVLTPLLADKPGRAKCYGVRGLAYQQLGRYREALADLTRCHELRPRVAQDACHNYQRAFLHGLRGDTEAARAAMLDQMDLRGRPDAGRRLARFLYRRLKPHFANLDLRGSVGVFLGAYTNAVGHAILDPFHYFNLFGRRFDNLVMVHPDLNGYTPATRLTMGVLEQYLETVRCTDPEVMNFAWQHLGELAHDNFTFLIYNYWSLNRLACKARQDPDHPLHGGRTYLRPPPKLIARAERLLRRCGVDASAPVVVVHAREHGYHELRGQLFRNVDIRNYVPALRKLLSLGYQVVRIGDRKMSSLRRDLPGLLELPLTEGYSPVLDPYFLWRSRFMISCQSGPCSYARVFGKPNLVVNAVYHHTLLPERHELLAFKDYRDTATGEALGVEEVFRRGAHLFDRTQHFVDGGVATVDMTAEEIEAALDEMLDWLAEPGRPETPAQQEFRRLMRRFAGENDPSRPPASPMSDYIGYGLPECRVSDAVAALRPGYLPADPALTEVA